MNQNTPSNKPDVKYNWFGDYKHKNDKLLIPVGGKLLQYMIACVTVIYLFGLFYFISKDKDALDENYLFYMFALIVPLFFMFLVILSNSKSQNVIIMGIICSVILMLFFASTYFPELTSIIKGFYYSWFDFERIPGFTDEASFLASLIIKIIMIGIVVVGLSLFYNLFLNQSYRQEGVLGFFIYFVFFIPCLLSDFIKYITNEFKTAPNIVFILFVLEIVFILLYIYLPANILKNSLKNGKTIIDKPMFLGSENIVGGAVLLEKKDKEAQDLANTNIKVSVDDYTKVIYNRNYAISLWLSYNPINKHKDDAFPMPIFKYGATNNEDSSSLNTGVPMISYLYNDEFSFVFTNNGPTTSSKTDLYEFNDKYTQTIHIPPQRWNNIVFNYHNSRVDLFINGSLERTIELTGAIPNYDATMSFIVGSPTNTLHGALCNTRIFSEPLTQSQITQAYNLLKLQNPPVNNLL